MRVIRTASEDNAILGFNGAYAEINEAIRRAKQLEQLLTEPALQRSDTGRHGACLRGAPFSHPTPT
jgi:hypothetical protein